jgi:hypothetical protein
MTDEAKLREREYEIACRELSLNLATAALRFLDTIDGVDATGLLERPLDLFRRDVHRAFQLRTEGAAQ